MCRFSPGGGGGFLGPLPSVQGGLVRLNDFHLVSDLLALGRRFQGLTLEKPCHYLHFGNPPLTVFSFLSFQLPPLCLQVTKQPVLHEGCSVWWRDNHLSNYRTKGERSAFKTKSEVLLWSMGNLMLSIAATVGERVCSITSLVQTLPL